MGIDLAISQGFENIWIESDCLTLVNLLKNNVVSPHHPLAPLIDVCRSSLIHFSSCRLSHVLREGNQVADILAQLAMKTRCNFTFFDRCPAFASAKYFADRVGISFPRGFG